MSIKSPSSPDFPKGWSIIKPKEEKNVDTSEEEWNMIEDANSSSNSNRKISQNMMVEDNIQSLCIQNYIPKPSGFCASSQLVENHLIHLGSRDYTMRTIADEKLATWPFESWNRKADHEDCRITVWDLNDPTNSITLEGCGGYIRRVIELANKKIAAYFSDNTIKVWDLNNPKNPRILKNYKGNIAKLMQHPDGRLVAIFYDNIIQTWSFGSPMRSKISRVTVTRFDSKFPDVLPLKDGRFITQSQSDHIIRIWDLNNLKKDPIILKGHTGEVTRLIELKTGKLASWSRSDHTIRVWDLSNLEKDPIILEDHTGIGGFIELKTGKLASWSSDHTIRVWDLHKPENPMVLKDHTDGIFSLEELKDGRIVSYSGNSITIWDLERGENFTIFKDHNISRLELVTQLEDGKLVVKSTFKNGGTAINILQLSV